MYILHFINPYFIFFVKIIKLYFFVLLLYPLNLLSFIHISLSNISIFIPIIHLILSYPTIIILSCSFILYFTTLILVSSYNLISHNY